MIQFPNPASQFQAYLGVQLDSQHKYIKVSRESRTLILNDSVVDEINKNKKQILLFERVIEKLMNTTEYKLYISPVSKVEAKAEIITAVFLENCKKNGGTSPELLTLHRITLANLLKYHMQTCLMSPSHQTSKTEEETTSDRTTSGNPRSSKKTQTALSNSNPSPRDRAQELNLSSHNLKKIPGSKSSKVLINPIPSSLDTSITPRSSYNDLLPVEEITSDKTTSSSFLGFNSSKSITKPFPLYRGSSQETYLAPQKSVDLRSKNLSKSIISHQKKLENPQELVARHLSEESLSYCYYYWLYRLTNEKDHKYLMEKCEKNIPVYDRTHLFNDNKFLTEPKLKFILQEQSIRALNAAEKNYRLFFDVDRTFKYTVVCGMNDKDSFQYENIGIADQVQSAQHKCLQFERFLLFVIKKLEGDDSITTHSILRIWKACVQTATEEIITDESFAKAGERFLYEIADHSRMQEERDLKFKLRKLISTFYQVIIALPASALTASLSKIKCSQNICNRCNIIKFNTTSKVEICIRNTLKFSTNKCKDFVNLLIENKLSADLSDFTSWSSEVIIEVLPFSPTNKSKVERFVLEPLNNIGIEVHQNKPLTLRKTDAPSSSSSAVDTDKNSSTS